MPSAPARDSTPARDGASTAEAPGRGGSAAGTAQAAAPAPRKGRRWGRTATGRAGRAAARRGLRGRVSPRISGDGREERLEALSPVDGARRQVTVRYPTDRVWGRQPLTVAVSNLFGLLVFLGVPIGAIAFAIRAGFIPDPYGWPSPALAVAVLLAPVAAWVLIVGLVDLVRGLSDLGARRQVEGVVLRTRHIPRPEGSHREGPNGEAAATGDHYLAVDDGTTTVIRAWRVPNELFRQVVEGTHIRAVVTPRLRFVRDLEVAALPVDDADPALEEGTEDAEAPAPARGDELPSPITARGRALPAPPRPDAAGQASTRSRQPHRLDPVWLMNRDEATRALGRPVGAPRKTLGVAPPQNEGGTILGCTYVPTEDPRGDHVSITVVEGPATREFLSRGRRGSTRIHGLGNEAWLGKQRVTVVKNGVVITIAIKTRREADTGVALLRLARAASNRLP